MLLLVLDDLETYEKLVARYLTLDIGLKRIENLNARKRSIKTEAKLTTLSTTPTSTIRIPLTILSRLLIPVLDYRPSTILEPSITYYNY